MRSRTIILAVLLAVAMAALSVTLSYGQSAEGKIVLAAANPVDEQTAWAINSALPDSSGALTIGPRAEPIEDYAHYDIRCIVVIGGDGEELLNQWREVRPDVTSVLVFGRDRIWTAMLAGREVRRACGLGQ